MITRVTNQTQANSAGRNLQNNLAALAKLQAQASSTTSLNRPSDDPTATATSLRIRGEQRATEQYGRNIDDGNGWLSTVEASLTATTDIMNRVRDLTVQGANDGALSPTAKEAIAVELDSLKGELVSQANSSYLGRTVFAGNSDAGVAFDGAAPYAYRGATSPAGVERRIGSDSTVRVDGDGQAVFDTGDGSVFALIDNIVSDLRGTPPQNVAPRLTEIDDRMQAIRGEQASVGARSAQIQKAEEANLDQSVSLEAQRSQVEEVDLGQIILELKTQEVSYQSALAVTARVLQPTLMDFLR